MSYWSIFWPLLVGFGAIAVGIFGEKFYAADIYGGDVGDKPVPKWTGKLLFSLVGIGFVVLGIARVFIPQH